MTTIAEITALLQDLSEASLDEVRALVESLRRREANTRGGEWHFDFIANFRDASVAATRDPAGMEVKVAEATCAGVTRPALWEHPPVSGSVSVSYLVPIPPGLRDVKLTFAVGIRDGAELPRDRLIAFRVIVNGWKLWSTVKNAHTWEEHAVEMPQLESNLARIEFVTDGLGDNRWNWAVWGEPRLEGKA